MSDWTADDLRGTLRVLPLWWDLLSAGVEDGTVAKLRARSEGRVAGLDEPDGRPAIEVVEAALADLTEAGRVVMGTGIVPTMRGRVTGVHASHGGVPKAPVESAQVGRRGLEGDRQASRRHHGRLWQALCLWSAEVIDELRQEGHPIGPGRAGENITVSGLDWASLRPGVRLRLGDVLAEVTLPAAPCAKNAQWFVGGDFMRMDHERHPGSNRWYARVVESGTVRDGDPAAVLP